jgi:hypothetical protein
MLKGQMSLSFTVFVSIVVLIGVFFVGIYFLKSVHDVARVTVGELSYMYAADASHFVEKCLGGGDDYITADSLDSSNGKAIKDVCGNRFPGLSGLDVRAEVTDLKRDDLGSQKSWSFMWAQYSGDPDHDIYVSIVDGDEVHAGRLHVRAKEA